MDDLMKHHFFTVDRRGGFKESKRVIDLVRYDDITVSNGLNVTKLLYGNSPEQELQDHLDSLFPEGLSGHGNQYFAGASSTNETRIEIIFEYVRRACYPDKPSRYTSFFVWATIEEAKQFRSTLGNEDMRIWKVGCNQFFRADMSLLRSDLTGLLMSYFAHRYWSGLASPEELPSQWEILLPAPIMLIEPVD